MRRGEEFPPAFPENGIVALRSRETQAQAATTLAPNAAGELNFDYPRKCDGLPVTARFGDDGITIVEPNANAGIVFKKVYDQPI